MKDNVKNKHLSYGDRQIIEKGITNGSSKAAIAETLGKDPSTIGKEIKEHRELTSRCSLAKECKVYKTCTRGRICKSECVDFVLFKCKRRDRSPGACNGCDNIHSCRFNKYKYDASKANNEYLNNLSGLRQGFNTTVADVKEIGQIMEPLLKNGQSIDQILLAHPEIKVTNKTIYSYIDAGLFKDVGVNITSFDLRRKVSRKMPKAKKNLYKKRNDCKYLEGRKYADYLKYIEDNPNAKVVQMDTVYNDVTNGPFIQTFKLMRYGFMFCVLHSEKTAEEMNKGVLILEEILGEELFNQEVEVLLTDRGSEFTALKDIEIRDDATLRTRVFYCDPMASHQKGSLENKHEELRYICPKVVDLYDLGLKSQEKMNLITSHINSSPRKKLEGKSPIELMKFLKPETYNKFQDFGVNEIEKDKVILKPFLIKD